MRRTTFRPSRPSRTSRTSRGAAARLALVAGTVVAALALTAAAGCSARAKHTAGVAPTFNDSASSSLPTASQPATQSIAQSVVQSAAPSHSASPTPQGSDGGPSSGQGPCPLPSPQLFVEGKQAAAQDGQVTFSYLDAQRICSGDENARYITIGKTVTTKPVAASAVVLLLAPGGGASPLQVPPAALPAAMAANKDAPPYYAITIDGSGTITRIEQAYLP